MLPNDIQIFQYDNEMKYNNTEIYKGELVSFGK